MGSPPDPRHNDAILAELSRFSPFDQLDGAARGLLARGLQPHTCPARAALLYKGQAVSGAYLVLSGRLRVYTLTPSGSEATLYFIDPGETCVLALNCLFNDLRYPAWVESETPSRLVVIPGPLYRRLFEEAAAIRHLTVHTLSTLVFRLMSELEQLHARPQRERLADFILTHADSAGTLTMTQQQLAHHLGTTREVVARLLRDMVRRQLVCTRRGAIDICDPGGLRTMLRAPD